MNDPRSSPLRDFPNCMVVMQLDDERAPSGDRFSHFTVVRHMQGATFSQERQAYQALGTWCVEQFGPPYMGYIHLNACARMVSPPGRRHLRFYELRRSAWTAGQDHFAFNNETWATAFRLRWM